MHVFWNKQGFINIYLMLVLYIRNILCLGVITAKVNRSRAKYAVLRLPILWNYRDMENVILVRRSYILVKDSIERLDSYGHCYDIVYKILLPVCSW